MKLEQQLVLNRYFHSLFSAKGLEQLKEPLNVQEGLSSDGQSYFHGALAGRVTNERLQRKLPEYDSRIMALEAGIAKARGRFSFKYFQYLALLYSEIFLDQLTEDPAVLLDHLNIFLTDLKRKEPSLDALPPFQAGDVRRLAFFMATGSGKTLLLHALVHQVLYYLQRGRHPEALVNRADRRREFDNIILITPSGTLSEQHVRELRLSGIDAELLIDDRSGQYSFATSVRVIEIHKLAEEPSKDGISVLLEELGENNLVFVDEGHKGSGTEARRWKGRQQALSRNGFLIEYSATFAQAVAAISNRQARSELAADYGRTILFDYSYRHFYEDGFGKDFRVLNLAKARESQADDLLVGGLLGFYNQLRTYRTHREEYKPYNIEKPLWVFVGSSVNAIFEGSGRRHSDVGTVVAFLKKFLENRDWAIRTIKGSNSSTDENIFRPYVKGLSGNPESLYKKICRDIFHGTGGLEIWELKKADGEFGLRVSSPQSKESPYFGLINIGNSSLFRKYLEEKLGIEVKEERFVQSLFQQIELPDSPICMLIGSKKFIEGWSSWRVSSMGLLNIGTREGPQVIQLFGRGVRLKGLNMSLKRSSKLPGVLHPQGLSSVETLSICGWNANYLTTFRKMIDEEGIALEIDLPLFLMKPFPHLPLPRPAKGYSADQETWILEAESPFVSLDLTPQVVLQSGLETREDSRLPTRKRVDFGDEKVIGLVRIDELYLDLLEYKSLRGYGNVFISRDPLSLVLKNSTVHMDSLDCKNPVLFQQAARQVLRIYLDRFVARKEREAESKRLSPARLVKEDIPPYTLHVSSEALIKEIEEVKERTIFLKTDGGRPLPRLNFARSLSNPLLLDPNDHDIEGLSTSPQGLKKSERLLVEDLRRYWGDHHNDLRFRHYEIYLLRNLPRSGIGFFRKSGFYPDFILWIKNKKHKTVHVRFLEPHGMHHGGLTGNSDKIEAFKELERISRDVLFRRKNIGLDGFLLTQTPKHKIPGAEELDWETLRKEYNTIHQGGEYIESLLKI